MSVRQHPTPPDPRIRSRGNARGVPQRRRQQQRRNHHRWPWWAMAVVVSCGAAGTIALSAGGSGSQGLPGPEGVPLEAGPALAPAGAIPPAKATPYAVQCGSSEQVATHIHSHLAVYVDGHPRSIPLGVGMVGQVQVAQTPHGPFADGVSDCLYWLHTHASDGIIHIEAPAGRTFVLGQFFGIWGQPLTSRQVGPATGPVTAYVNGQRWTQPLDVIPLTSHEAIQLDVGTPIVAPRPVSFPSSL